MRYLSVCSGIEAASVGWEPLGWSPVAFAEIEPFPSAVLAHRFPNTPNLGDFTKIGKDDVGAIDLLVGGTPCFAAGTLIVTDHGFIPIEAVVVGDRVLTHEGRYRAVTATGAKMASTIRMRGQGIDVVTTENHRFWSQRTTSRSTRVGGVAVRQRTRTISAWAPASDLVGCHVATPAKFPSLPIPPIAQIGREHAPPIFDADFAWIVGLWLGDGWTRTHDRGRGTMIICAARGVQSREIDNRLRRIFAHVTMTSERTTDRFAVSSAAIVRWLRSEFGSGAFGKRLPTWVLGMSTEMRRAMLGGYLFADGSLMIGGRRFTTVSPILAMGFSMLAHSLGFSTTRYCYEALAETKVIEGRTVSQRPFFQVNIYDRARSSYEDGAHRFGRIRSIAFTGRVESVYDLTVEEDHSYVANGAVAHNCQDFSVAGLRAGLAGDRGALTIEFLHLAERLRPEWLVWENVPGVLSADGGRAFGTFLGLLGQLGYGFAYRILDAKHFGVPQRRRRVFVVGCLGDWRRAGQVLFDKFSLSGNLAPRSQAGSGPSLCVTARFGSGRNDPTAETYVAHTLRAEGFDASEDGTGRGVPLVPTIAFTCKDGGGDAGDDISPTLRSMHHLDGGRPNGGGQVAIAFGGQSDPISSIECAQPVTARNGQPGSVAVGSTVRRLTPAECEKLQGFPPGYTLVPYRGKPASDGPRYRSLGNSFAVPVISWIGSRINRVNNP